MTFLIAPRPSLPTTAHLRRVFCVLAAFLVLGGPANACEFEPRWTGLLTKLLFPNASSYALLSDPAQSPRLSIRPGTKPNSVHLPKTKQLKRLRIVRGERLRVESPRIRGSGKATSLNFKDDGDAFDGSLHLAERSEHRAAGWSLHVASLNGKNVWVSLTYDTPRSLSEALDDAVCTYQSLPQLVAQAD